MLKVTTCLNLPVPSASLHASTALGHARELTPLDELDEVLVRLDGGRTCWETEDEGLLRCWLEAVDSAWKLVQGPWTRT